MLNVVPQKSLRLGIVGLLSVDSAVFSIIGIAVDIDSSGTGWTWWAGLKKADSVDGLDKTVSR